MSVKQHEVGLADFLFDYLVSVNLIITRGNNIPHLLSGVSSLYEETWKEKLKDARNENCFTIFASCFNIAFFKHTL